MKFEILKRILNACLFDGVVDKLRQPRKISEPVFCSPLNGVSKSLLILKLNETEDQIVLLLPDSKSTEEIFIELNILGLGEQLILLEEFSHDAVQEKLTKISRMKKYVLVSTYELLALRLPTKEQVEKTTTLIQTGGKIKYDELIEYLNLLNYQRDKFIEAPGEFSVRGSIIDFWSYSEHNPARLEFDGDFLESIRFFDPESQRSIEKLESISLAGSLAQKEELTSDIFDYFENPLLIASSFELQNRSFKASNSSFNEDIIEKKIDSNIDVDSDEFPEKSDSAPADKGLFTIDFNEIVNKERTRWILEEEISSSPDRIELGFSEAPIISSNYQILFNVLKEHSEKNYDVILTSENELQTSRLTELLSEFNQELAQLIESRKIKLETLPIKQGFLHNKEKILLLTDYQIFNKPYRTKLSSRKKPSKSKSKTFASITNGDYVVHETYGIGKYAGLKTITIGEAKQESMKLLYNEGGIVYVNLNYLNLVKRYSSNENLKPTLSTLGTGEWERRKSKTKKKIKEAARELIELYAKRKATIGFQFSNDSIWQKELEASFFMKIHPTRKK